jgi:hypothetical protein
VKKSVRWLSVGGFFGLLGAADAQTASPPAASTQFDGTYAFVSATKVNETFTDRSGRMKQCEEGRAGSLAIVDGHARLRAFEGTVGPQGELVMRNIPAPLKGGENPGIGNMVTGRIDKDGTVRARRMTGVCSYDIVWRKESK